MKCSSFQISGKLWNIYKKIKQKHILSKHNKTAILSILNIFSIYASFWGTHTEHLKCVYNNNETDGILGYAITFWVFNRRTSWWDTPQRSNWYNIVAHQLTIISSIKRTFTAFIYFFINMFIKATTTTFKRQRHWFFSSRS